MHVQNLHVLKVNVLVRALATCKRVSVSARGWAELLALREEEAKAHEERVVLPFFERWSGWCTSVLVEVEFVLIAPSCGVSAARTCVMRSLAIVRTLSADVIEGRGVYTDRCVQVDLHAAPMPCCVCQPCSLQKPLFQGPKCGLAYMHTSK